MAFTLRQLRYFVAAAENGSISRAAQELAISQSALTEAIKALELDLGVQLFERHARGLNTTHEGHRLLRHATKILAEVATARRAMAVTDQAVTGQLQLGVTALMAGYVISDLLARYRRANPEVEVSITEDNGEYLEHLLIGGELDVAVMAVSNLHDPQALQVETFLVSPFRLWLPIGHHLLDSDSISIEDLAGEDMIVLNIDEMDEATVKIVSALGRRPRIAYRTRSVEAVRSLVATGAGIALLPDLFYRPWSLEGDRIEARDVSGALPVVQVGLAWRRGAPLSEAARDFVAIANVHGSGRER
ncbi:DNA-binding transcriptional regulator, LysR family [Meinhardsimonia xiamenensis]|jgi:DNA-binding transcriptional LysR family regulator|uniref:DNA-binding transcriptional regulator, LysR family n=1 Tax=Meinhardsimonia xiamenensis TaxID=990712 RepID=A0A1G9H8S0_9RHOB|nr:LysR family transcriptional regulator [Meinhardsimonia xiamenensis]PRX29391.1 DNA-binding transcriptional LysR family regulator [Meinhardsimonia xiamenensis]SDL09381.1 DNA-binding transcriptional regulator, LysR family [Meinhardsimonia xiamenensis]